MDTGSFNALKDHFSLDGSSGEEFDLIYDYLIRRDNAIGYGDIRTMRAVYKSFSDKELLFNQYYQENVQGLLTETQDFFFEGGGPWQLSQVAEVQLT
jgi:RNAse (barnase) inhibitor barstar